MNSAKWKKIATFSVLSVYLFIDQRALADEVYLFCLPERRAGELTRAIITVLNLCA